MVPDGNMTSQPAMFEVSNRNTRTRCELCSKSTIKTLVSLFLTLSRYMPADSARFFGRLFCQQNSSIKELKRVEITGVIRLKWVKKGTKGAF